MLKKCVPISMNILLICTVFLASCRTSADIKFFVAPDVDTREFIHFIRISSVAPELSPVLYLEQSAFLLEFITLRVRIVQGDLRISEQMSYFGGFGIKEEIRLTPPGMAGARVVILEDGKRLAVNRTGEAKVVIEEFDHTEAQGKLSAEISIAVNGFEVIRNDLDQIAFKFHRPIHVGGRTLDSLEEETRNQVEKLLQKYEDTPGRIGVYSGGSLEKWDKVSLPSSTK